MPALKPWRWCVLLCALFSFGEAWGQTDTEFWFVAPEVWAGHGDSPIVLRFATLNTAATITVEQPANPGFPVQTVNVPANGMATLDLTPWMGMVENKPVNTVLGFGLHITSTADITAYYEVDHWENPDIFTLKGGAALGTSFRTPFQTFLNNNYPESTAGLDIVATEDGTVVTVTPATAFNGHPAGVPFDITLGAGQTYSMRAASTAAGQHPAGTLITSTAPIAVTMSDDSIVGSPYGGTCFDLLGDQLIPVAYAGTEYIAVKGPDLNGPDKVFILATEDGTEVFVNGLLFSTLDAGDTYTHTLLADVAHYSASAPVLVLHLTGVSCEVAGAILPPLVCTGSDEVAFVRSTDQDFSLTLLVETGAEGGFSFNGNPIWIPAGSFSVVPGSGGAWSYAQIANTGFVPTLGSSRVANSLGRFHLGVINGMYEGFARYGYFSDFRTYFHTTSVDDDDVCAGETVTLMADPIVGGTYEWSGPGAFTASGSEVEIGPLTLADAGEYIVTGMVGSCPIDADTLELVVNPGPDAPNVQFPDPWCPGDEAVLEATGTGDAFVWTGPSGELAESGGTVAVNEPGMYSVLTTSEGCASEAAEIDLQPAAPVAVELPDAPVVVCEGTDWELPAISVPAGEWSWYGPNAFEATGTVLDLGVLSAADAGWYVLDGEAGGCPAASDSIELQVIAPTVLDLVLPATLCTGDAVTVFQVDDAFDGTWACPGCTADGEFDPNAAAAGVVDVTYVSNGACAELAEGSFEVLETPSAAFGAPFEACLGQGAVALAPEVAGGTWDAECGGCVGADGVFQTGAAGVGIWSITYTLSGNCPTAATGTFEVTPNASSNFILPPVACANAAAIALAPDLPGGAWSSDCGSCLDAAGTFLAANAGTGSAEITYTLPGVCGSSTSQPIEVLPLPDAAFAASVASGCAPLWVEFTASAPAGGGDCEWLFTGPGGQAPLSMPCGSATHVFSEPGCYEVAHAVTDANGCTSTASEQGAVCVTGLPEAAFSFSPALPEWSTPVVSFSAVQADDVAYAWSVFGVELGAGPEWGLVPADLTDAPWYVCLEAVDSLGCAAEVCQTIAVGNGMSVHAPNAFTPDNDGRNDAWQVVCGDDIAAIDLQVYDRWGQLTFTTTSVDHHWDGRVIQGTHYAPNDVYLWQAIVYDLRGRKQRIQGHVTLIR